MVNKELEQEANEYAERIAFRVPYDGSNDFYDTKVFEDCNAAYIAGATQSSTVKELEREVERLKGLINEELKRYWIQNEYQEIIHSGHKAHTASELAEAHWQQFKTENNL